MRRWERTAALAVLALSLILLGAGLLPERFFTNRTSDRILPLPVEDDAFTFAIFGDRTGGPAEGVEVLHRAVGEVNLVGPDLVMTVGDLIEGYTTRPKWVHQARQFKGIMDGLKMAWFPVAGNHDVYWRGPAAPEGEHEAGYEKHFGPLWYAFSHKGCWFIVLYTDEGDPATGEKGFGSPRLQQMSPEQFRWLKAVLKQSADARHVFVFLHHPRWQGGKYGGSWEPVHEELVKAGNVSGVFAGHIHRMTYGGNRDGIEYFTLATTGGHLPREDRHAGLVHHYTLVTVRDASFTIASIPVGAVMDPRETGWKPPHEKELLPSTDWKVADEASRTLSWNVEVPEGSAARMQLEVGIGHSTDDSGDRGLTYKILDGKGGEARSGFLSSRGIHHVRLDVRPGSKWTILIEDADTTFKGRYPGNGGTVQARVRY